MKAERKRRLETAGWKETTVQKFLSLSEADVQYIEMKLALGPLLRVVRERRRLTQTKAFAAQEQPKSTCAMEAGDPSVSLDLLVRGVLPLGASRRDLLKAA
jgi:hypothetical protein